MKWERLAIEDLCLKVTSGGTPLRSRTEFYEGGTIPWIKTKEVNFNRIYDADEKITEKGLDNSSAKLIPENSILIAMYGDGHTAGRCAINRLPVTTNQACCNLVINPDKANPDYMFYKISTLYEVFKGLKSGGSQQNLNAKTLKEFQVQIPPLHTQRKIASILSAYDDLIENNLKRIKLLEEKAFLMYKGIVREEKFSQKAFNEVADYINGYPFKPDDWKDEGLPIIKIKELKAGVQSDTPRNDGENISEKYFIENKDILFAWSASIGAYLWCSGKSILNQHIFNVKPFDKDLHNWLYFSLLEKIPDFINLSNGATMQHIKKSALGMVYLPVPPKKVYEEFQKETEPILNLIVNLNQQNTKLREARDILLPNLMNRQIEV